jgi:hypothetical protein
MSDHDLSNAYLRLRALIPGAYDTPNAPTPEQVWETTESALRRLLQERDLAKAIHHEIISPESAEYALEVWRDSLLLKTWSDADRMKSVLGHVSSFAIEAVLDGRTGRAREVVPAADDVALRPALRRARREERELCARHIEARAIYLRDHGPTSPDGLLTALAGAQVGALLDAAASLRTGRGFP